MDNFVWILQSKLFKRNGEWNGMERNERIAWTMCDTYLEIEISKINKILLHTHTHTESQSVNSPWYVMEYRWCKTEEEKTIPAIATTFDFLLDYIHANVFPAASPFVCCAVLCYWQKNKMLAGTLVECSFGIDASRFGCAYACAFGNVLHRLHHRNRIRNRTHTSWHSTICMLKLNFNACHSSVA